MKIIYCVLGTVHDKVQIDSSFDASGLNSSRDFFESRPAGPPTILTEDLGGFPQSSIDHDRCFLHPCHFVSNQLPYR